MPRVLLILVNDIAYLLSHRADLALAAKRTGYEVIVVYGDPAGVTEPPSLIKFGIKFQPLGMRRGSLNPVREAFSFLSIIRLFVKIRPDLVYLISIKPYIYGAIAATLTGVPAVVSAVNGLGSMFIGRSWRNSLFRALAAPVFTIAFRHHNQIVIVQNRDDADFLVGWGVLKYSRVRLIRGAGVKLNEFTVSPEPEGVPTVVFVGRLLRDKGINDFVSAARTLYKRGVHVRFRVVGDIDRGNPTALTDDELTILHQEGIVEFLGYRTDIAALYAQSHIACLPSFREGLPKALIEAAAAGRVVVTTDVPGCRDVVIPNVTGLLVPPGNPEELANALHWLIAHPRERLSMGVAGRGLAEREFALDRIISEHLDLFREITDRQL